jgi:hypothetical protein
MPTGLNAHQIINERERFIDARIQQCIRELEAPPPWGPSLLERHWLGASYHLPKTHHVLCDLKNHSYVPVPGAWTLDIALI